ncbi:ABC transporter permease [Maritimibacter sp. UBA3975]|uniref:ABC transporter permease n=1 Tax=Maritimibacter sp. UBA3975 TaxID=1946833 RepID=UPI000C0A059F|nr:ABC transporter permease [Maritimibacter sp. UBA3975]MAM63479.1 ABC transporter permease [Maritimibacter sp.]|tara:strand:+ start:131091 stop:131912 length:822 start_codon:yes stop_codon:yes gene_type:complete
MFRVETQPSRLAAISGLLERIYHATVHNVRKTHSNALMGLFINMLQTMMLVAVFYVMYSVLGLRGAMLRGDFLLYIMSGIFLYMTQTKTMGAVVGADGPASPMMQHAPMSTFISIAANSFGALYIQILSVVVVVYIYHIAFNPVEIQNMAGVFMMLLLAWFSGIGIGMVFYALKPWFPQFATVGSTIFARANMIASGKMFVANTLPFHLLALFSWNPLFHIIDQARGFMFINYNPHYSSWLYPLIVSTVLLVIGFMGESYTRKHASLSWNARR